ncbi:MAG: DUF3341 domain-containing protein [Cyclobacteriaceae bacterium]|nr:DUF3341 domain-containing protein [Cyclobacteriaceae bacterium]
MERNKNFIIGVYSDPDQVKNAAKAIIKSGIRIHEVYTPFPIHGIEDVLGYKKTRLPIVAFLFGVTGTFLALFMQVWMLGIDWPMIIGGKDHIALPAFIPVTFELTVLLSALGMVGTFMVISDLKPYKKLRLMDIRITDDKHVIAIDIAANSMRVKDIQSVLKDSGADEINEKNFE